MLLPFSRRPGSIKSDDRIAPAFLPSFSSSGRPAKAASGTKLARALACAAGLFVLAASAAAEPGAGQTPSAAGPQSLKEKVLLQADQKFEQDAATPYDAVLARDTLERVLTGEFALKQDDPMRAWREFMRAARKSRQAGIAELAFKAAEAAQNEEAADEAFALWTELDPDNRRVRLLRTGELFTKGQFAQAGQSAAELLKDADDPAALLESIVQLSAGTVEKTRLYDTLSPIFSKDNEDARVELVLASLAASAKMREQAREHGIKAIELAPDNPHVLLQGADYEYALDPKAASRRLEAYLKDHPASVQVRLSYAKSLLKTGEKKKLDRELSRIETERKDDPRIIFLLGMFAEEGRMYDKAELYYKKYLVLLAKNPDMNLLPDSAYVRLGMVDLARGREQKAVEWLDKVERGDKYQAARIKEVEILAGMKKIDEACRVLKTIRTNDARQKSALLRSCAGLLLNAGRDSETVDVLLEAIKATPEDAELIYQTAMTAHEVQRYEDSERLLRAFISLMPDNANGYNSLGYMWLERGVNLKEAGRLIEKAMSLTNGKDPYVTDSLGWLRYKEGNIDQAEELLVKARSLEPADHEIALHLAEVLYIKGKRTEARGLIETILKDDPDNEAAHALIEQFEAAGAFPAQRKQK